MCGRFLLRCPPENWPADLLGGDDDALQMPKLFEPRQNISPTQNVLAITASVDGTRSLQAFRWGLVPPWADDLKIGASMINARSETVDEKPSFRKSFLQRRCLIPADGYYEWITRDKKKYPMRIERPGREVFCFAGLYERNESLDVSSCTIITAGAGDSLRWIHDRTPLVIAPTNYPRWLDPNFRERETLKGMLSAPGDDFFEADEVEKVTGR